MTNSAQYWIDKLELISHPEGGYYRETYRAELAIAREALPSQFTGPRLVSTAIYFLLEGENFSAFHRLRSDELWHFYAGTSLVVHVIEPDGGYSKISIGGNPDAGESLQAVVKAGRWRAARFRQASILRTSNWRSDPSWSPSTRNIEKLSNNSRGFDPSSFQNDIGLEVYLRRTLAQRRTR
jgi:predicted cupin superfamily sugar epimerase